MPIRELIARKSNIVSIVAGAALVGACIAIYFEASGPSIDQPREFFTDDNGKSWFEGSDLDVPPIQHNGKEALRAYVYQWPDTGKKFVAFVERVTPEARPIIIRMGHSKPGDPLMTNAEQTAVANGHEFHKVSDCTPSWINGADKMAMIFLQHVAAPDGKVAVPVD